MRDSPWPRGDSRIYVARRRCRRGEREGPSPAYLLKQGADAIAERVYSLMARALDLPSAVVFWADYEDTPLAAIRYEQGAIRPDHLDATRGVAVPDKQRPNETVPFHNAADYFRHLALSAFADEGDGEEYLLTGDTLIRIDAAACFSTPLNAGKFASIGVPQGVTQEHYQHGPPVWLEPRMVTYAQWIARDESESCLVLYVETLQQLAACDDLAERVAADLRTAPAADTWQFDLEAFEAVIGTTLPAEWIVPKERAMLPYMAASVAEWIAGQQRVIREHFPCPHPDLCAAVRQTLPPSRRKTPHCEWPHHARRQLRTRS